ncbi:MAG: DUF393 domain-containing protein [Chloroflexi bacterium]|nr:DUF393 domain-containing protein [Chloroflexota bacterium]
MAAMTDRRPVVLFDGVCNFCHASVNFVLPRDPKARVRFATLQSEAGQRMLREHGLPASGFTSIVLIVGKKRYTKSGASLRILRYLRWPWPALTVLLAVPPFIRNWAYDVIAGHRYRWFGQMESCPVPGPELERRTLR